MYRLSKARTGEPLSLTARTGAGKTDQYLRSCIAGHSGDSPSGPTPEPRERKSGRLVSVSLTREQYGQLTVLLKSGRFWL